MRQIKLDLLVSEKIGDIGGKSIKKIDNGSDLKSLLISLFPEREGYWRISDCRFLKISFLPNAPFGPDPEMLSSFLFDDLESDIEYLINRFNLNEVSISGISPKNKRKVDKVVFNNKEYRKELKISAYEVRKLLDVSQKGETTADVLLSVLLDKDRIFTYIIPDKINFSFIFSSIQELLDYQIDEFCDSINGCPISSETVIASSQVRYISPRQWRVKKPSSLLFSYPYFNKTLKVEKQGNIHEEPCCNCLTCAAVCTAALYPSLLYHHIKNGNIEESKKIGLSRCSLCRKCSLVCPSNLRISKAIGEGLKEVKGEKL